MSSLTLEEQISHAEVSPVRSGTPSPGTRFGLGPISFIFCLTNAAIFTAAIAGFLKGQQVYRDLVSGELAAANGDKGFDFRLFYFFLVAFGLLVALLVGLGRRLQGSGGVRSVLERSLALALIPFALWFTNGLTSNSFGHVPIECLVCGSAALILLFSLSRPRLALDSEQINQFASRSMLVLVFGFFGGLGLATVLTRIFHISLSENLTRALVIGVCGCEFASLLWAVFFSSNVEQLQKRFHHIVFGSQLLLPFLWAVVIPPAIIENGHSVTPHEPLILLTVLFSAAMIGWVALIYRWRRQPGSCADVANSGHGLVTLAIVPIAVFVATNHPIFPTFVGDDFHTGEHLLLWQQLHDFGKLPFVDFVPVHPLMDFLVSGANALFFDGTLANYENSRAILFGGAAALTFLAVARFGGVGMALCLAMAVSLWDRLLIVPLLFVILCDERLLAKSFKWLLWCGGLCLLALGYNPAVGVAITLAASPIAMIQLWRLLGDDPKSLLRLAGLVGLAVGLMLVIPFTRAMSFGFAHFLVENSRTVVPAHGIAWQVDEDHMPAARGLLATPAIWEIFRFSWIVVLVIAAWIFLSRATDWRNAAPRTMAISALACLFLFFLSGWTITRIDANAPSRTGEVSFLAVLYILPLVVVAASRWRYVPALGFLFVIGFFQGGMGDFLNSGSKPHSRVTMSAFLAKPSEKHTISSDCVSIDGPALGLPNLGHIYAPKKVLEPVVNLQSALKDLLRPGETYLDLTARQANYFYLGMPVAVPYGATWLAANTPLQNDLLFEIRSHPPPVVWIAPGIKTQAPQIRTYKLYRFLLQNYVPISRGDNVFLVDHIHLTDSVRPRDDQLKLLSAVFDPMSLERLPSAWGSSWSYLQQRFMPLEALNVTEKIISNGAAISLAFADHSIGNKKGDFLKLDFFSNLSPRSKMELEITWNSDIGPSSMRFTAANGTNLIPIGTSPAWLLSQKISELKIAPVAPPAELKYALRNAQFFELKD